MTPTVTFVVYLIKGQVRRVGPLPIEAAEAFAKEVARKPYITKVGVEKWACVHVEYL